ncbi:Sec-independent protein translocase protein TatB [Novosphingobium sp.]|uniref:Sec-independent protein translocase protein TatB n=1 Tax=Novosphingobium sp. TaxID=1874826 RepID=UPI0025CBD5D4|nr:Sec-independent protein translocase protein TatB [Novosphingobium sp.]
MFDIAPSELLVVVLVAIVVIGPKDLPIALRTAGKWIGKMRRMSAHFRSGVEAMIREAELEEMEKKWREQNAAIMAQSGATPASEPASDPAAAPVAQPEHPAASAEAGVPGLGLLSAEEAEQFHAHLPVATPASSPAPPQHPPTSSVAKAEAAT